MRCQAGPGTEREEPAVAVAEDDASSRRQHAEGAVNGEREEHAGRGNGKAEEGSREVRLGWGIAPHLAPLLPFFFCTSVQH